MITSDRRLKQNILRIGESPSGIPIYRFEYRGEPGVVCEGVMADDGVPYDAVNTTESGYLVVDYSKIDVDFKKGV